MNFYWCAILWTVILLFKKYIKASLCSQKNVFHILNMIVRIFLEVRHHRNFRGTLRQQNEWMNEWTNEWTNNFGDDFRWILKEFVATVQNIDDLAFSIKSISIFMHNYIAPARSLDISTLHVEFIFYEVVLIPPALSKSNYYLKRLSMHFKTS